MGVCGPVRRGPGSVVQPMLGLGSMVFFFFPRDFSGYSTYGVALVALGDLRKFCRKSENIGRRRDFSEKCFNAKMLRRVSKVFLH